MKTKEGLAAIKEEGRNPNEKLSALTEEDLEQVTGGSPYGIGPDSGFDDENDILSDRLSDGVFA